MPQLPFRTIAYLIFDVLLLLTCIYHIPSIMQRPTMPFRWSDTQGEVIVGSITHSLESGGIHPGEKILKWETVQISFPQAIEFLADAQPVGQGILLTVQHEQEVRLVPITLVPYYPSLRFVLITFFVGIVIWGFGVFVLLSRHTESAAIILHWTMVLFATSVMMTWGAITPLTVQPYIERGIWFISYMGSIATFFFFTSVYPRRAPGSSLLKGLLAFIPATILAVLMAVFHFRAMKTMSVEDYASFQAIFTVFQASLFVYLGAALYNIVRSYRKATTGEDKKKLQWILWGLGVASTPFLLLHILPQVLFSTYIVPEEYTTIAFLAVPFAFTISLVRYRFLDIETLISRSVLYGMVSFTVVLSYFLITLLLVSVVGEEAEFERYFVIGLIALLIGLLINPFRLRVQRLLDETLFPARAHFRKTIVEAAERMEGALHRSDLLRILFETARSIVTFDAVAVYDYERGYLVRQAAAGAPMNSTFAVRKEHHRLFAQARVFAVRGAVAYEHPEVNTTKEDLLHRLGCALLVPLVSNGKDLLGVLAARPSASSGGLKEEEVDLLRALCFQAAKHTERLLLQRNILLEREERKRMEELSALKSEFVSYVSHEFQNPLTVIKLNTEFLRKRVGNRKAEECTEVIEGEADRLSRMVSTILDVARIEQGMKQYAFRRTDVAGLVRDVLKTMQYQILKHRFRLVLEVPRKKIFATVDPDAFSQALMNLVSNGLKYGRMGKYLKVSLANTGRQVSCSVTDRGPGISKEALGRLFERYYRDPSQSAGVRGVGLGLSLVKHIMDAHEGRVEVTSELGKGTTFTLLFPAVSHEKP